MKIKLPPLPAHPVMRAYDRTGAPLPGRGWTDAEVTALRALQLETAKAVLEAAAKVCDQFGTTSAETIQRTIRAMEFEP